MNWVDYIFDPNNPWICQEFILYRKDFNKNLDESGLIEKIFDINLIEDYCVLLEDAFSFQNPPSAGLCDTIKYMNN